MSYPSMPEGEYPGPTATRSNGLAIAGLVCGIVGLLILNIVLGPLAIIFGGVGLTRANRGAAHRTMSIWAIALGVVDLIIFVLTLAVVSHGGSFVHAG